MKTLLRTLLLSSLLTSSIAYSMQKTDAVVEKNQKEKLLTTINCDCPTYRTGIGIGKSAFSLGLSYLSLLSIKEAYNWSILSIALRKFQNQRVKESLSKQILRYHLNYYHLFAGAAFAHAAYSVGRQVPQYFSKSEHKISHDAAYSQGGQVPEYSRKREPELLNSEHKHTQWIPGVN